jgi:hypothetical protein
VLTDRDVGDAFQAPAQRYFHSRCASRSRDAAYLRNDGAEAVAGI